MKQTIRVPWLDMTTSEEFYDMLEALPPIRHTTKIPYSEDRDGIGLPYYNIAFDNLSRELGTLPSQEEYGDYYVSLAQRQIDKYDLNPHWVKERAMRNYYSFVTEYSIFIALNDRHFSVDGLYDRSWDFKGIDFKIKSNRGSNIGLCVISDTDSARDRNKVKDKLKRNSIDFPTYVLSPKEAYTTLINNIRIFMNSDMVHNACVLN